MPLLTLHHQIKTCTPSSFQGSPEDSLDHKRLAQAPKLSPEMLQGASISSMHATPFQVVGKTLHCDVSSGAVKPLAPEHNRHWIFQQIHE